MKRKLAFLGLAGVLLFSGISVSAASDTCGHPASTTYYTTVNKNYKECKEHENCQVYEIHGVKAYVCHYCGVTVHSETTFLRHGHTSLD
ncbi:MAG: hypothetical protein NC543_06365 [bacterium]|nr:hypothetical protein [bacterium]